MRLLHIRLTILIISFLITTLFYLIPYWPNFTPVAALALIGTATFERLLALLTADALIRFCSHIGSYYRHQQRFVGLYPAQA